MLQYKKRNFRYEREKTLLIEFAFYDNITLKGVEEK